MDRELCFKIKSVQDTGEIEGFVSFYGNKDLNGDIVEPGAFTKTLQENGGSVPLLLHHDRTRPIGTAYVRDEAKGLWLTGKIATQFPDGALAHGQAKEGILKGLSIGFREVPGKTIFDPNTNAYHLKEVILIESSMVTIPANPRTNIESVKTQVEFVQRAAEDIKAGRTLSAATRKRLESAITDIQALLAEADALDEAAAGGKSATADEPLMHSLRGITAILRA